MLIVLKLLLVPIVLLSGFHFAWLIAVLLAVTSALEYIAMRSIAHVSFFDEKIVFGGVLKKRSTWDEIENIILKDDLLTIDYKNNRLFQRDVDADLDEASFNEWCTQKLSGLKR